MKYFLLGAGLALVVAFAASSVFAQSLMPCGSLGGKMVTTAECDTADKAQGIVVCATGQLPTPGANCIPGQQQNFQQPGQQLQFTPDPDEAVSERDSIQYALASGRLKAGKMVGCKSAGGQQATVEDCLQAANDIIAGKTPLMLITPPTSQSNYQNQRFNQRQQNLQPCAPGQLPVPGGVPCFPMGNLTQQSAQQNLQQPLFGQQQFDQQQTQPKIITPTIRSSGTTLASKGLKLALKMQSSLNSTYSKAKGRTKKLAAVRSIAKKLPTLCRYISSGDDEADLDEGAFNCDVFVAELSEPIGEALQAKDHEVAYESTVAALESFGEVFNSLK